MSTTLQLLVTPISTTAHAAINTRPVEAVALTPVGLTVDKTSPEAKPVLTFNKFVDNVTIVFGNPSSSPKLTVNKLVFKVKLASAVIDKDPIAVFN
jgi:hypothetical protein